MATETQTRPVDERNALRAEYEKVTGKKAFPGWNATDLRGYITAATAADRIVASKGITTEGEERVNVVITGERPHVFLPLENGLTPDDNGRLCGTVPDEWRNCPGFLDSVEGLSPAEKMDLAKRLDPQPVPRRARIEMPKSCAQFLSDREQCEVL